jgi:hypothetical protein
MNGVTWSKEKEGVPLFFFPFALFNPFYRVLPRSETTIESARKILFREGARYVLRCKRLFLSRSARQKANLPSPK